MRENRKVNNAMRESLLIIRPIFAAAFFIACASAQAADNSQAADDKPCSQQERSNQTLSEKLDQTAGVICPPDIDLAIKAPTPNAGKTPIIPPPGSRAATNLFDPSDYRGALKGSALLCIF